MSLEDDVIRLIARHLTGICDHAQFNNIPITRESIRSALIGAQRELGLIAPITTNGDGHWIGTSYYQHYICCACLHEWTLAAEDTEILNQHACDGFTTAVEL